MNRDWGPTVSNPRGKGPRTKKQARRRRDALLRPVPSPSKNWAPRTDGVPEAVLENGTLQERERE